MITKNISRREGICCKAHPLERGNFTDFFSRGVAAALIFHVVETLKRIPTGGPSPASAALAFGTRRRTRYARAKRRSQADRLICPPGAPGAELIRAALFAKNALSQEDSRFLPGAPRKNLGTSRKKIVRPCHDSCHTGKALPKTVG